MEKLQVTKEQMKRANDVAKANGLETVFMNEKGEFFSNKNFAALSVEGDKNRYVKIDVSPESGDSEKEEGKKTNDLGPAGEVVAAIEAATDVDAVEAILTAEKAGKNRKTVLEAAEKKIKGLTKTEE
ncbi:hypothetical protein [Proteiniphilum sp.]|uniref:hypothetical protein n=1 Tax=Proteiniphilum sp. TaxID=1926877 RepID=UPI002B203CD2|nr:hypothetical protein [Proteiniphilum sp.]MEA4916549.1 hypothetical protein [Proteiniphilum sp.]MEA4948774.1 hypothetical protein [Petrimonas sp.]